MIIETAVLRLRGVKDNGAGGIHDGEPHALKMHSSGEQRVEIFGRSSGFRVVICGHGRIAHEAVAHGKTL